MQTGQANVFRFLLLALRKKKGTFFFSNAVLQFKIVYSMYSQVSPRRTQLGPVLCVRLREMSIL